MTDTTHIPENLLPMTPAMFNILLALADGEKHGYAIMLEVEANTQGAVKMGPGTLYGSIKRMLASGLIEECDERPDPALDNETGGRAPGTAGQRSTFEASSAKG
jgi:hypothetical protein